MDRKFTRKHKTFQLIILCICVYYYCIFVIGLIRKDFFSEGTTYIAISIIIISSLFVPLVYFILDINRTITITTSCIIIKKPFRIIELEWLQIIEFIRQEKVRRPGWIYSLTFEKNGEKQIDFADNNIENIQELIDSIFKLAVNAKFIEIRNEAFLPFFKKLKPSEWKNT